MLMYILKNLKMLKINKGEKYECIKDGPNGFYFKGNIYPSEINGCITDAKGNETHQWETESLFNEIFIKIEDEIDEKEGKTVVCHTTVFSPKGRELYTAGLCYTFKKGSLRDNHDILRIWLGSNDKERVDRFETYFTFL